MFSSDQSTEPPDSHQWESGSYLIVSDLYKQAKKCFLFKTNAITNYTMSTKFSNESISYERSMPFVVSATEFRDDPVDILSKCLSSQRDACKLVEWPDKKCSLKSSIQSAFNKFTGTSFLAKSTQNLSFKLIKINYKFSNMMLMSSRIVLDTLDTQDTEENPLLLPWFISDNVFIFTSWPWWHHSGLNFLCILSC